VRASSRAAMRAAPGLPGSGDEPVFREPWEAQTFAMTVALHERGVFSWSEWAAALAAQIQRARASGDQDTGETSYRHWLAALERLLADRGVTDRGTLDRYADAWGRAAERTPHGQAVELRDQDLAGVSG
jgi:nitrile hydratase accessory protein